MRKTRVWFGIVALVLLAGGSGVYGYDFIGYMTGEDVGDQYGSAMCTVDFNADGFPDLVVSAPADDDAGTSSGKIYIYFGGPAADTVADLTIVGAASSFYGQAVASAGDFNGDTYEDLIVGAPFYDSPASNCGAVYLYYGGPSPDTAVDHIFTGENVTDYFGTGIAGIGDFNGDTYDDIAIGAYKNDWGSFSDAGKVYVYYGGPSPDFTVDRILVGEADGERFGYAVTGGDFNGDNVSDIAVGAYSFDSTALNQGRIYVFYGGTSPDTVIDLIITGDSAGYKFGWSLATGRVSNDAYEDLIMGTDGFSIDTFASGKVYVYYGGSGFDNVDDYSYTMGRLAHDYLGDAVASAVDLNQDGYDEFIAGMPGNDDGGNNAGGFILFSGGTAIGPDTTILGNSTDEELGEAVVLWQGYGNSSTYIFAGGASAYNSYQGRVFLYRKSGGGTNQPPVLDPIGPKSTDENVNLNFTVTASDPDGPAPSLTTSTLPTGASFTDHGDGSGTFDWTPTYSQAGVYYVTFYASDGIDTDSEEVEITVNDVNRAPVLNPIGDKTVKALTNLNFTVTASDPDGTTPQLSAVDVPSGASFTDNSDGTGTFDWTPVLADTGSYDVTFIAYDGSLADSEIVTITVLDTAGCCILIRGNADGDAGDQINVADLTYLVNFLFKGGAAPPCEEEGDVDGSGGINVADLTYLVNFLFKGGYQPPPCP